MSLTRLTSIAVLTVLAVGPARAERPFVPEQSQTSQSDWCRDGDRYGRYERFCEVRPVTIAAPATLDVETSNGSIAVTGSSRPDVSIEARVEAQGDTANEAKSLAKSVQILTDGGRVRAEGPNSSSEHHSWWVSFRIQSPTKQNATINTSNGSVTLSGLDGTIRGETSNGSMHGTDLAGDVRLSTSNGSLQLALSGTTWSGAGLEATTSNGSMRVDMPRDYSAHLSARTANGSLNVNRPITVTGRIGHDIDTDLGKGGPTLRLRTGNGSLSIRDR